MRIKPSPLVLVLRCVLIYAASYGLYWLASFMVGSPHEFRNLWAKATIPLLVVLVAIYFNRTGKGKD